MLKFVAAALVVGLGILILGLLTSQRLPIHFTNEHETPIHINQVELDGSIYAFNRVITKRTPAPPFADNNFLIIPDARFAKSLTIKTADKKVFSCMIKNKSMFHECMLRAGITKDNHFKCACDGTHDFN